MTKNIKNIGKELLGKSLNSFHRKTGLTQLEENNKMQDGILNGILNQVDDAYIEKTEQSNVIHLEGSGDGVVALDSIEGNTMVNLATVKTITLSGVGSKIISNITRKINTVYTLVFDVTSNTATSESDNGIYLWTTSSATVSSSVKSNVLKGRCVYKMTSTTDVNSAWNMGCRNQLSGIITIDNIMILEGDWTNKEIPAYFEGLQSSFEENITDEGQYKFEILSNSENILNMSFKGVVNATCTNNKGVYSITPNDTAKNQAMVFNTYIPKGTYYYKGIGSSATQFRDINNTIVANCGQRKEYQIILDRDVYNVTYNWSSTGTTNSFTFDTTTEMVTKNQITKFVPHKQNKIKLLINEPLRSTTLGKDRLCIVDGKLMIERKNKQIIINGEERYKQSILGEVVNCAYFEILDIVDAKGRTQNGEVYCDRLPSLGEVNKFQDKENIFCDSNYNLIGIKISRSKLTTHDIDGIKTYFRNNNTKLCYPLKEPYYEEVLNEYGEPILLEGYENGTLYIDSTIVPTTTVRYTPKMESLNTLKEVNNNNVMLTNDINDMIVPYMMEVDLMIMEKEMAIMSHKNIRKIGAEDMTSMQKRTYDMLARLIKGKTLTVDECKTRVTVYLNADKITDAQAEELILLIDEVYA